MADDDCGESLEEKPYRAPLIPERYPKTLIAERYPPGRVAPEPFGPISAGIFASLQEVVNRAAGEALVDRQVLHVDYVEGVVPEGGDREPDQGAAVALASGVVSLPLRNPDTACARLLQKTFALSCTTLDYLERCPAKADTGTVATAARDLARAETNEVFGILAEHAGDHKVTGDTELASALAAVAELQAEGFGCDLAVVFGGAAGGNLWRVAEGPGDAELLARLERNARAGLFVAPGLKAIGLAIAPCRDTIHVQVARNFRLRWLASTGLAETFAVDVGFRVIVSDPTALRVLGKAAPGQGAKPRRPSSAT